MNISARNKANRLMLPVLLFAFFIGLYHLADARISNDELKTLTTLKNNSLFSVLINYESSSHVFFTFLLNIVHHLTDKLVIYRWVPVISGVLAVAMAYRAGKVVIGARVALVGAALLPLTPIFVQYLREMRGYATTVFLGMVVLYSLRQGMAIDRYSAPPDPPEGGTLPPSPPVGGTSLFSPPFGGLGGLPWPYWAILALATALGIYTHLYFLLIGGAATLIVFGEWWVDRHNRAKQRAVIGYIVSMVAAGLLLVVFYGPIVSQVAAVPENQTLRAPLFGPFALSWDFISGFINAFIFFSPLEMYNFGFDYFLILVLVGTLSGLWQPAQRRATLWLLAWWLLPFFGNLLIMALASGSSAQIRFHLHVLPAYLFLGAAGLFFVLDSLTGLIFRAVALSPNRQATARLALYSPLILLLLMPLANQTITVLYDRSDEAWSDIAVYLRAEAQPGDLILCEAFSLDSGRGGDDGTCGWQLQDVANAIRPALPIQPYAQIANYRGLESHRERLDATGNVWFVIYFPGPPPATRAELDRESPLTVKQFRHSWVIRADSGQTLLDNLIATGHWLLRFIPDERHQFDYHVDVAHLYALNGDGIAAQSHLEQALPIQQASADPDWAPEMAKWREAVATLRFYAPAPPTPHTLTRTNFDNRLMLDGYALDVEATTLRLSFYWRAIAPIEKNYAVFVHLQDAAGQTVSQFDFHPFDTILPTSAWPVGLELREARQFSLPADLPPGDYTFSVGLYSPETMARLPIIDDSGGDNAVEVGPVAVGS